MAKLGSDKEVQAMTFNLKEDRLLEKTLQTIDIEESYAMKLLQATHRQVKLGQKRMKRQITKIRTKLDPEEIANFKQQEQEGSFKPEYRPVTASGVLRISAATKRLKLQSDKDRISSMRNSARESTQEVVSARKVVERPQTSPSSLMPRRAESMSSPRRDIASPIPRPTSALDVDPVERTWARKVQPPAELRPMTCREPPSAPEMSLRPNTAPATRYSSHRTHDTDLTKEKNMASSVLSLDSSVCESKKERDEEMRKDLLELEHVNSIRLKTRAKSFMDRTSRWIRENTAYAPKDMGASGLMRCLAKNSLAGGSSRASSIVRRKSKSQSFIGMPPDILFAQEEPTPEALWKDLKKCRYLRISPDQIDLSGVNTLAKTQMQLFTNLKTQSHRRYMRVPSEVAMEERAKAEQRKSVTRLSTRTSSPEESTTNEVHET